MCNHWLHMMEDRIERGIVIHAPMEVVWGVVTEPEHISAWFSDQVELDLRPGGEIVLTWGDRKPVRGRVERVEPPRFFAFRWMIEPGTGFDEAKATLVEFRLNAEGGATRLTVVESGFSELALPEDEQREHFDDHSGGWKVELGHLADYADEGR